LRPQPSKNLRFIQQNLGFLPQNLGFCPKIDPRVRHPNTFETVNLQTRTKIYGALVTHVEESSSGKNPPLPNNLHIERLVVDLLIHHPKGELRCTTNITSAHDA